MSNCFSSTVPILAAGFLTEVQRGNLFLLLLLVCVVVIVHVHRWFIGGVWLVDFHVAIVLICGMIGFFDVFLIPLDAHSSAQSQFVCGGKKRAGGLCVREGNEKNNNNNNNKSSNNLLFVAHCSL